MQQHTPGQVARMKTVIANSPILQAVIAPPTITDPQLPVKFSITGPSTINYLSNGAYKANSNLVVDWWFRKDDGNPNGAVKVSTASVIALQSVKATSKGGSVQFDVSHLHNGTYYLHVYDGVSDKPEIRQIIVKH